MQEETKVAVMSRRLQELGVDVDALLADIIEGFQEEGPSAAVQGSGDPDDGAEENLT